MFFTHQESQQPRHRSRQAIAVAGWISALCLIDCKDPGFLDPLGDEVLLEPLFAVREARDVATGAPLQTVRIGAFVWNGVPVAAREELWASPEYRARLEGNRSRRSTGTLRGRKV